MPDGNLGEDTLFGRLSGQSRLKQGDRFLILTPDAEGSDRSLLLPALELEGSFAIVRGILRGNILFEARLVEVAPPILSEVFARLIDDGDVDAEALLPRVERSIRTLVGVSPPPAGDQPLCALIVGHRPSARGAVSRDGAVTEFDFNRALAEEIRARVEKAEVRIVFRDNDPQGYSRLPAQVNRLGPSFIVSLHCNAFDGSASGSETLYFHSSKQGHELAKIVQRHTRDALELRDRHTKPKTAVDRGGHLLKLTDAPCVIGEPFFIDNDDDLGQASARVERLAGAYAAAIDEAAEKLAD